MAAWPFPNPVTFILSPCTVRARFEPELSYLENCRLTASSGYIDVYCTYRSDTTATGFYVVAQMRNFSEVHKLYTNQSANRLNLVTVQVGENGEYQVTIFPMREGMGILTSNVEYTQQISVMQTTGILFHYCVDFVNVSLYTYSGNS